MAQFTVQLSEPLADRCKAAGPWLSAILELSLAGFKTPAAAAAAEVIAFLVTGPSAEAFAAFHISDEAQLRLQRLLALNAAGFLSPQEHAELDELHCLEHLIVLLKMRSRTSASGGC